MGTKELSKILELEEGRVPYAYQDHLGYWTIGVGRLIDRRKGGRLKDIEINFLLTNDILDRKEQLEKQLPWISKLSEVRRDTLILLAFQLGVDGLLLFRKMLAAMQQEDWDRAANELLDSKFADQTPGRALRLANQLRTGQYQYKKS